MLNAGKEGAMVFEPGFVQANVGDVVEFIPSDLSHGSQSIFVPKGAKVWQGTLNKKVSTTLGAEGVYIYECNPHSMMGMVGVIQVGKAKNLSEAKKVAAKISKKFALNKNRLLNYMAKIK
ncbi:MAG: pseudoazurin [Pseudomonadota bacterium]